MPTPRPLLWPVKGVAPPTIEWARRKETSQLWLVKGKARGRQIPSSVFPSFLSPFLSLFHSLILSPILPSFLPSPPNQPVGWDISKSGGLPPGRFPSVGGGGS